MDHCGKFRTIVDSSGPLCNRVQTMHRDIQRKGRRGQAVAEFTIMMALLMLVLVMLALLLYTFREYGNRVLNLVASEYP